MKISQILKEDSPQVVLVKMATTINPASSNMNGYTDRSCFGKVAHYLKSHQNPNWYILLFGIRGAREVTHCCLYDEEGTRIVDTFDGAPANVDGDIVYVDKDNKHHELLISIPVGKFIEQYVKQ